jgi:hypothetical protein
MEVADNVHQMIGVAVSGNKEFIDLRDLERNSRVCQQLQRAQDSRQRCSQLVGYLSNKGGFIVDLWGTEPGGNPAGNCQSIGDGDQRPVETEDGRQQSSCCGTNGRGYEPAMLDGTSEGWPLVAVI